MMASGILKNNRVDSFFHRYTHHALEGNTIDSILKEIIQFLDETVSMLCIDSDTILLLEG